MMCHRPTKYAQSSFLSCLPSCHHLSFSSFLPSTAIFYMLGNVSATLFHLFEVEHGVEASPRTTVDYFWATESKATRLCIYLCRCFASHPRGLHQFVTRTESSCFQFNCPEITMTWTKENIHRYITQWIGLSFICG